MKRKSYSLLDFRNIINDHGRRIDDSIINGTVHRNQRRVNKERIAKEIGMIKGFLAHYYDLNFTFEWTSGGLPEKLIINERTEDGSYQELYRYNFLKGQWQS